jgi:outer membrane protein assembly factor BamB
MYRPSLMFAFSAVFLFVTATPARSEDWPQWRGPGRDGVWSETGLIQSFDSEKVPLLWETEIGPGYNGPTVAGGKVFAMDRQTEPIESERVLCFDADTGKPVWKFEYECVYQVDYPLGPRASVTLDEGRAYALGTMGHLHCLDTETGAPVFHKHLMEDYEIDLPIWGIAASPLIHKDLVILHIGGKENACVVALDKKTGEESWRALREKASYSSPILIEQAGEKVLVVWTGESLSGLSPDTGKVHWSIPFPPSRMVLNVATPVQHQGHVFVSAFYDGSMLVRLGEEELTAEVVWKRAGKNERNTDSLHSIIGTPYLKGDYIYGNDSYGELRCLELLTGERVWENLTAVANTRWGTIHFVENGDREVLFNEHGDLIFARLSPEGYEEIDRAHLIDPTSDPRGREGKVAWSHPAYAGGRVYARNDTRIVCADLSAD